ncbi:HlyD family efflux transporter periplasmic adaptor subunit [Chitinibacteraceae bacterium HSL-7]
MKPDSRLPLTVIDRSKDTSSATTQPPTRRRRVYLAMLLAIGAAGGAAALEHYSSKRNSAPAAGQAAEPAPSRVVALGRLTPSGELRVLAAPFGAGDARVTEVLVEEGQEVLAGTVLARFDNTPLLDAAFKVAEQQLASRQAALLQAERAVSSSQAESSATLARAEVTARATEIEYRRWAALADQGFVSPAAVDLRRAQRDEAGEELRRARAAQARHAGNGAAQPDLLVARHAVEVALAELDRAGQDRSRGALRAPQDGTVIAIHVRPGERPGSAGVLDFGDTRVMTAELELYQADVIRVSAGQAVTLHSPALDEPLQGSISHVGLSVGRQHLTATSPAANIDARVVLATVVLDDVSSVRARNLIGLEVQARIQASQS